MNKKKLIIGCLAALYGYIAYSQNETQIWYFGNNVGLDFSTSPPSVINGMSEVDNSDNVLKSAASISDSEGNFLFGTNGKDIYSADLQKRGTLPNGSNYSVVQGSQIIKSPGSDITYYISSVPKGDNGCSSPAPSLIPISLNRTIGYNIDIGTPITLSKENVSEGQMILPKTNPLTGNIIDEYWIIYHELETNNFHIYELTSGGISFVKKEATGPYITNCAGGGDAITFMKANSCYNQFALSNNDKVNLFDFDTDNANITFKNSKTITAAYGIEFSPNGKKIFVTTGLTIGDAVDLYSIDVSPGGIGSNLGTPTRVGPLWADERGGSMQLGPDGKIYVGGMKNWGANGTTEYLGVISDPDGLFSFDPQGIEIPAPGHVGMGFPLFPTSLLASKVEINDTSLCEGDEGNFQYDFIGAEQDYPDRLWQFFDNSNAHGAPVHTSTNATASYTWSSAGTFAVTFRLKDVCGVNKYDTVLVDINTLEIAQIEKDTVIYHLCDTVPFKPSTNGVGEHNTADGVFSVYPPEKAEVINAKLIMKDSGSVTVYYSTIGPCPATDSLKVIVREVDSAEIDLSVHDADKVYNDTIKFCAKDTTFSLVLTDKSTDGGNWSTRNEATGTNLSATDASGKFDASGLIAGLYSVKYSVSKYNFCSDSDSVFILISPLDTAEIIEIPTLCIGDYMVQLEVNSDKPSIGVWSDTTNLKNEYITADGKFKLNNLQPNKYPVIFTPNEYCSSPDTNYITITNKFKYEFPNGDTSFCLNNNPDTISINLNAGGGRFWTSSGEGISTDSMHLIFSLYSSGQIDSLYYGKAGQCGDTVGIELTLLDADIADVDSFPAICLDAPAFNFTYSSLTIPGGIWSGPGTDGSTGEFSPSNAGSGIHSIKYTTSGTCSASDSVQIVVKSKLDVSIDSLELTFCGNSSSQTAVGNIHLGLGRWEKSDSWPGDWDNSLATQDSILVFDPKFITPNTDSIFYMIDSSPLVCGDTVSLMISIDLIDIPDIDGANESFFCQTDLEATVSLMSNAAIGGTWQDLGGGNNTITKDGKFDPSIGQDFYQVEYITPGFCFAKDTHEISVFDQIIVDVDHQAKAVEYCNNFGKVELTPFLSETTSSTKGEWHIIPNVIGGIVNKNELVTNVLTPGVYSLKYTLGYPSSNCKDSDSVAITILPTLDPTIDNAPLSDVCVSDSSYIFTTSGDVGGTWSSSNGASIDFLTGEMDLFITTAFGEGTFNAIYTHSGCVIGDTAWITIVKPGDPSLTSIGPFCENLPIQSQVVFPPSEGGVWSSTPVPTAINSTTGEFNPMIATPGDHLIRYDLHGTCPVWDTMTVVVADNPEWDLEIPNNSGCESLITSMFITSSGSKVSQSTWSLYNSGEEDVFVTTDSLKYILEEVGDYDIGLQVIFENGCQDTLFISNAITVNAGPEAGFDWGPKNATVLNPHIQFYNESENAQTYYWDLGRRADPVFSEDENPYVKYNNIDSSSYWVRLIAEKNGCSDTVTKRIWILDNFSVYVPAAFTPNGNNNVFFPKGKNHDNIEGLSKYSFMVFNRWGELIWETKNPYKGWDGTYKKTGNVVQQDVYVWRLKIWDNVRGVLKNYYGNVSLLR